MLERGELWLSILTISSWSLFLIDCCIFGKTVSNLQEKQYKQHYIDKIVVDNNLQQKHIYSSPFVFRPQGIWVIYSVLGFDSVEWGRFVTS